MYGDIIAVWPTRLRFAVGVGRGVGFGGGGEETDGGGLAEEIAGAGCEDEGGEDVGCCGGRGEIGEGGGHWVGGYPVVGRFDRLDESLVHESRTRS